MDKAAKTFKKLCELDFDAIEAYEEAIDRLDNKEAARTLAGFRDDHREHTRALNQLLTAHGEEPVDGPDMKRLLTEGKVIIADLMGDKAIMKAMLANEKITNKAYKEALEVDELSVEERAQLNKHYADEQRHHQWIKNTSETM